MEFKGIVISHEEPMAGESQKGPWKKQGFVFETLDQYPKKIYVEVWNDKVQIPKSGTVTVHFNVESRDYNGRWYTSLTAWKIESEQSTQPQATTQPEQTIPQPVNDADNPDGLPF